MSVPTAVAMPTVVGALSGNHRPRSNIGCGGDVSWLRRRRRWRRASSQDTEAEEPEERETFHDIFPIGNLPVIRLPR